jgi:hypothetical protein
MLNRLAVLASAVTVLATGLALSAQSQAPVDHFTFVAGSNGERFDLVINRWSTDAERDRVRTMAGTTPAKVLTALGDSGVVGYVHLPGGLDYTIRYARRIERSDGTTDVIALTDHPAWIWWDEGLKERKATYPFTVIQLRIANDGVGTGKLSPWSIGEDREGGIALADYDTQPSLLTNVRRNTGATAGRPS